jgi:hypothetical protein
MHGDLEVRYGVSSLEVDRDQTVEYPDYFGVENQAEWAMGHIVWND